ncbi:MAG: hypothetical protein A4S09_01105 [Proteobacteria bacterium SG_bin7]|nr:MAG: hypothetical protein A4S09_01105 [Proteobacteria bacterium SG_bin7]
MFYDSKTLKVSSAETGSKMFIEGSALVDVSKNPHMAVGWAYAIYSSTDATTSTTTVSSSDMGPKFTWFIDKKEHWSLSLTYNLIGTGTYSTGSSDTWRGTSLKADVGWGPPLGDNSFLGIRLNYYSATYTESLAGGTSYSQVSYARSFIYPSVFVSYRM